MLRKLMKYEFKATARTMLPLSAVTLLLSVFMAFVIRYGENIDNPVLGMMMGFVGLIYGIALCAVVVVVLVQMVNRFRNNVLGDEGYITLTLPVSMHKIIWSKIIVSSIWFVVSMIVVCLSAFILVFQVSFLGDLKEFVLLMWNNMTAYYALNGTAIMIEALVSFFFGYASFCLMAYAAMSIGYSFSRRKGLISIGAFLVLTFVSNMITSLVTSLFDFGVIASNVSMTVGAMASVHLFFLVMTAVTLVYCAAYYVVTTYMLKHKLNME